MDKITKANYKAPLYPIGDKFTTTPARVGHLNLVIDEVNTISTDIEALSITPGTVTQTSSVDSPAGNVTINSKAGIITMFATLTGGANFVVNNSFVTANSVILITVEAPSNADSGDRIDFNIYNKQPGLFGITINSSNSMPAQASPYKIHFLVIG